MSTNFPSSVDNFPVHSDNVGEKLAAASINNLQDSVVAIETALGTISNLTTTNQVLVPAINEVQQMPVNSMSRQALINGNFDVWQRGTSFTNPASNAYTADRWKIGFDGTGQASTVSQQAFTLGQTSVPKEPKYFYRYQVTTAATSQTINILQQFIESVRTFAGQKCTLSFWAKADVARTISATLRQSFGTGGSPSVAVDTSSTSFSLTTSWQKFTYTFNLPSISGKTLGTNGDDLLALFLYLPTSTLMTIDIAQVQLNAGDQPLPFQPRSFAEELALCRRYYFTTTNYGAPSGVPGSTSAVAISTSIVQTNTRFPVHMRITPTFGIISNGSSTQMRNTATNTYASLTSPVVNGNANGAVYIATSNAPFTIGTGYDFDVTADAEL